MMTQNSKQSQNYKTKRKSCNVKERKEFKN